MLSSFKPGIARPTAARPTAARSTGERGHDLVLIDASVPEPEHLLAALARPCRVVRVAARADGLEVLRRALSEVGPPPAAVHVVSHGAPARVWLGGRQIDVATLRRYAVALAEIRRTLAGAPVVLYGCSVGAGDDGQRFVAGLAAALDSRVIASTTPTGAAEQGGDWRFDVTRAPARCTRPYSCDTASAFSRAHATWPGLLAGTVSNADDAGAGSFRAAAASGPFSAVSQLNFTLTGTQTITLSTGTVTARDGIWDFNTADSVTIDGDGIVLAHTGELNIYGSFGSHTIILNSNMSGSGDIFFGSATGDQTVVLGGTNTFNSRLTVSHGDKLSISSDDALGSGLLSLGDGTLVVTGATTIDNQIEIKNSASTVETTADVTVSGAISGTGSLTKTGASTLTLSGTNTYSGSTTVSNGILSVSADSNLGTGGLTLDGGNLTVTGTTTIDNTIALGSATTIANSTDATLSGVISGANNLTKAGAGTLTLSGTNTFSGTTTITGGSLSVSADGNLGTGGVTLNGGGLTVTGTTTIDNTIVLGAAATIGSGADVTLSGVVSGANNLTKAGAGTLTLTGANTYTGTTSVTAGTLTVNGALNGGGTLSVASGGTLAGSGSTTGAVTVASGGALTPGNSPGLLSTGDLTLAAGATTTFELNGTAAGTQYDQIAVTGTVDVSGSTLTTVVGFTPANGNSFILIDNDGVDAVTGTFTGLAEGASFTSGGRSFQISYIGGTGNDIVLSDVGPAPASSGGSDGGSGLSAGSSGADLLYGTNSPDLLRAEGGADTVYGLNGDDTLSGGVGADHLRGQADADILYGNEGGDVLYGNQNSDTVFGGQDADTLYGGQDSDVLYGNLADDALFGGRGDDRLYGGQGADSVAGNNGDDLLFGNLGADRFLFSADSGADTIGDFSGTDGDVIAVAANVNGSGIATTADLLSRLTTDAAGHALLDLGDGNTVTLIGVQPTSLSVSDFVIT